MTLSPALPQSAVDLVVVVLVRLLLPALAGDTEAAKALALDMLTEYQPHTIRELCLAAEIVGLGLDSLNALTESVQPGVPSERLAQSRRWACSLSRTGHQAQRRLDALQRARQRSATPEKDSAATTPPATPASLMTPQAQAAQPYAPGLQTPQPPKLSTPQQEPMQSQTPQPATPEPQAALLDSEGAYAAAVANLNFMKARYKGAPPPHSQAAQQIQAQQRVVDAARMKLELLRKTTRPTASQPDSVRAAA